MIFGWPEARTLMLAGWMARWTTRCGSRSGRSGRASAHHVRMEAITCDVSGLGASFNPAQATRSKGIVSKSAVTHPPRRAAIVVLSLAVAVPAVALASKRATLPAVEDDALVVHALNRLGYGPRPGDVEKVRAIGLEKWIDRQLHPDRIADPAMGAHLASLRTIRLSTGD